VNEHAALPKPKAEKPMHLRDYHRQKLLNGIGDEEEDDGAGQPLTYNQEQEQLKQSVVKEIQAAAGASDSESGKENSEAEFLIAKEKPKLNRKEPVLDVDNADRDPETYLSNFMASRAWTQTDQWKLQPFESDDEEEERRAEEFEQAYNMRFEDPAKSNEKLRSHARDLAAKYSVRRDEVNPRQKRREAEKSKKEAVRQELRDDKARLRKLRIGEVEEKVRRIKRAAGLHTKDIQPEDWSRFVDEEWDDAKWDEEMQQRFGEKYYAEDDVESSNEDEQQTKRKVKKPKFDDDIDIKDIVPGYEDEDERIFNLSDEDLPYADGSRSKSEKKHKKSKENTEREARKERRLIEQLVDAQLQLEVNHSLPKSESKEVGFRYRQTSPQSFGLTSRDILMADDSNLNQYAGLKKLAAFRDADKKRKDQKHLGKKARLRKWRKEVFGNEDGLQASELLPSKFEANGEADLQEEDGGVDIVTTGKKRKKRRGNNNNQKKTATVDV
jgi:protein KRI1